MRNPISFICLLAMLAGCATTGRQFDMKAVDQIKTGVSTKDDVMALLGQPSSMSTNGDGRTVLNYNYVQDVMGAPKSRSFTVTIAPDGTVVGTFAHSAKTDK